MENFKEIIEMTLNSQTIATMLGFLGAILTQYLLRKQIADLEIRKIRLAYRKEELNKLKNIGEKLIKQIHAYDKMAIYIINTLNSGINDIKELEKIQTQIQTIKEEVAAKFQIYFHELTEESNAYSTAIANFHHSFFSGLKYEGLHQKGYSKKDIERMNKEYTSIQLEKHNLVVALINFLSKKENEIVR